MVRSTHTGTYRLAMLPVAYVVEQDDMFDRYCKHRGIDPRFRDVVTTGIWAYQLYVYRELVQRRFGGGVGQEVWRHQQRELDGETGAGPLMERAFALIQAALDASERNALGKCRDSSVSSETSIALSLLIGMPESPVYSEARDQPDAAIRGVSYNLECCFSECLSRGRSRIQKLFEFLVPQPCGTVSFKRPRSHNA